jgi:6-phosphogluconolactonase
MRALLIINNLKPMKKLLYLLMAILPALSANAQQTNYKLVIGTYTAPGKSEGIYVYDFNTATAAFNLLSIEKNVINPSFLALNGDRKFIYAVNEDGTKSTVSAFNFDAAQGKLGFLNKQDANGADPCYLIADKKNVIISNYTGGSIAVYGKDHSGALSPAKQIIQHTGSSIDSKRQSSAHVHMARFTPDGKYVVVNDLGEDRIYFYTYNPDSADSVLVFKNSITVKPGSGPRHIIFSPNGKYAYLIQEMTGAISVFSYKNAVLSLIQEETMVAKDFKGENGGADIQLSADGKFLYASNRGTANTITTFAIGKDGKLLNKGNISTTGKGPRAFSIDPSGDWVLVGHQLTNDITIFKRNKTTGMLTDTGKKIDIGAPVCFLFVPNK